MIRTKQSTPAAAYKKPRKSPRRHFRLSPDALQSVERESVEAWAAVLVAAAKASGGPILCTGEDRLRTAESLSTFDLGRYEIYDGEAADVAAESLWPLDAVSHPAV
jgi:hypothetical protein